MLFILVKSQTIFWIFINLAIITFTLQGLYKFFNTKTANAAEAQKQITLTEAQVDENVSEDSVTGRAVYTLY